MLSTRSARLAASLLLALLLGWVVRSCRQREGVPAGVRKGAAGQALENTGANKFPDK